MHLNKMNIACKHSPCQLEVLNQHQMSPGSSYTNLGSSLDLASTLGPDEEHAQGSLRFSLFYDQMQSRLVVTVLDAQYLAVRDFSLSVDPFVWVRLFWAEREDMDQSSLQCVLHEWQTRLVKKSCSPVFGDQFSCAMDEEEVSRVTVKFEVSNRPCSIILFYLVNTFENNTAKIWSNHLRNI